MKIIEKYSISKTGNQNDCEDLIFFNSSFAAIVDGATSRNGRMFNGQKSGLAAATITINALEKLNEDSTLEKVIEKVNEEFLNFYKENDILLEEYDKIITASAIIFSRFYKKIWMIGDCQCLINGMPYNNPNGIDHFVASTRSFINQAELLKGKSLEWVANNDPGNEYIKELLTEQFLFQNSHYIFDGAFSYTAFDGRNIKEESVKTIQLDCSEKEIVLASDGYPKLERTLRESENALLNILKKDPLCIFENKCVKGVKKGLVSFDDRAYLRFSI